VSSLQRAAEHGAATIAVACAAPFADSDDDEFANVVSSATAWATALGELSANLDATRAWTDPRYRSRLLPLERDLIPPHPAGEISLEGTLRTAAARFPSGPVGESLSTDTVAGEQCCSTGHYPDSCDPPSGTYAIAAIAMCLPETNGVCCPETGTDDPTLTGNLA
jgi:mersacidin/lichenicidin family type 2 lantibiotic